MSEDRHLVHQLADLQHDGLALLRGRDHPGHLRRPDAFDGQGHSSLVTLEPVGEEPKAVLGQDGLLRQSPLQCLAQTHLVPAGLPVHLDGHRWVFLAAVDPLPPGYNSEIGDLGERGLWPPVGEVVAVEVAAETEHLHEVRVRDVDPLLPVQPPGHEILRVRPGRHVEVGPVHHALPRLGHVLNWGGRTASSQPTSCPCWSRRMAPAWEASTASISGPVQRVSACSIQKGLSKAWRALMRLVLIRKKLM